MANETDLIDRVMQSVRTLVADSPDGEARRSLVSAACGILGLVKAACSPRDWETIEAMIFRSVDEIACELREKA